MRWRHSAVVGLALLALQISCRQSSASEFAVSQYGRVTATLPWAVALKMGYFRDEGINIDKIISGKGGGTTLRNMLASDLPYGEVATSAALAAQRSGVDIIIVNTASDHIGEIALVANPKSSIQKVGDLAGKRIGFTKSEINQRTSRQIGAEKCRHGRQSRACRDWRIRRRLDDA